MKIMKRFLALALCAAMLFGMLPVQQVRAEDTDATETVVAEVSETTETEETPIAGTEPVVTESSLVPDEYGNYNFYTMEELKQLASMTFDSWTWANYAGSETFVIDESVSLPNNLPLGSNGAAIEIAEDVVVDVHEGHFDKLVVNGTLNIEALQLYQQLDVNGVLNVENSAYFNMDAVINGAENISYANDDVTLGYWCKGTDLQSLKDACTQAENETNSRIQYVFYLQQEETLSEDLTVPENVFLQVRSHLTVASGATLTLNADVVHMYAPVTVYGGLQHNGWASINYPNAMLTIAEGATYSGDGVLVIHGITDGDPTVAIPGLDTTGYELSNDGWEDGTTWQMTPEGYNPDVNNGLTFATVEELKALIDQGLDPWTNVYYTGEDALVIDETIVCPEYLMIQASGAEVRIGENGNLTVQNLNCDKLAVEGTLNVATVGMQTSLNVTGIMNVKDGVHVQTSTELDGLGNICFQNEHTCIFCEYTQVGKTQLLELVEQAKQNTDPRWLYVLYTGEEIVLDQDLIVPGNVQLYLNAPVTVTAGTTLTVNCYNVICNAPMTVEGTLENNSWIRVDGYGDVSITFGADSTYTGSGSIAVQKDPSVLLEDVLPGLVLSNWNVWQENDWWWHINPIGDSDGNGGSGDGLTFANLEELKELAAQTYENWTSAEYTGSEPLVIDETISCPQYLMIYAWDSEIRIAETGNLRVDDIYCDTLTVEGELTANYSVVNSKVEVTGTMNVVDSLNIKEVTELVGYDHICFRNEWSHIDCDYQNVDFARMIELIEVALASTDPYWVYSIYPDTEGQIVLEQDLTMPSNTRLHLNMPMTVAPGYTLTLNCANVYLYSGLTVEGSLNNQSWTRVEYDDGGLLTIAEGGSYTGSGTIVVYAYQTILNDPSAAVPGLDMTGMEMHQDGDSWWYIYPAGGSGGDTDGYEFSSIEELKELAAQTYDGRVNVYYTGSEALVIDEAIECPDNMGIYAWETEIQITENGSLNVNELFCDTLIVAGELTANWLDVFTKVDISGKLTIENSLNIKEITEFTGRDNISFVDDWSHIDCDYQNVDATLMMDLINAAYESTDPRWVYSIYPDTEGQIVLEQDLTMPYNTRLHLNMPMTVAAGYTLTLNCRGVELYSNLTVEGTLVNNRWIDVQYENGGLLTIAEGGTYSGNGQISIYEESLDDPTPAVPGLDLTNMEIQPDGDWWWYIYPIGSGGNMGGYSFSTLEELQMLAQESWDSWTQVYYTGEEDLVISEDIVIPQNMYINAESSGIVINEGVTVDIYEMVVGNLTVNGELNADNFEVVNTLTVTGKVNLVNGINLVNDAQIVGYKNINFANTYMSLYRTYKVTSDEEFLAALSAATTSVYPNERCGIQLENGPITLTEDAELPKDCTLNVTADLTIAENVTLTVNGSVAIGCPLTVCGTLVNNCQMYTWSGQMIIAEGGKYEGRGVLNVYGDNEPADLFVGLNLDDFKISNNFGYWELVYIAGLTPMAAPSELEWGYAYKDGEKIAVPGAVSWKTEITDTTGVETVWFYRINEDGTETRINMNGTHTYNANQNVAGYNFSLQLLLSDLPSGRYYFTVSSQGDYETTQDSEVVTSGIWEYTKPAAQLNACTNIGWSDDAFMATWTNSNTSKEVYMHIVSWYYKSTENGQMMTFGQTIAQGENYAQIREYIIAMLGTGYYSYSVQPISADITKACNGAVSERSEWYHLEQLPESPTVQLGGLLMDNTKTDEEKLDEVQNMGADTLKEIIEENSDVLYIVEELEEYVSGGAAEVEVSDETVEIEADQISIIGANLNSKENEDEAIKLVIDKVEEVRDITGNYDTSTAVQFSMTLENVKDSKNLEVPVVVTIPVPAGMAADKVVVLHYHDDGTYDVINPEITIAGGKTYAQFVLTSFSDFAILEKLAALLGDMDGTEVVNVDDVLALLWHVLFPTEYPLNGVEPDIDGNGQVNVDDVLALLWHVLFPDEYPLK